MADLTTTYLGLTLNSPLVVSASPLSLDLENVKRMADCGAGAIVLPSLFEEQIEMESTRMDYYLSRNRAMLPDGFKDMPDMKGYNQGTQEYIKFIYAAKAAVDTPIIASLNGSTRGGWLHVTQFLVDAGADALELNLYYLPTNASRSSAEIETQYLNLVQAVKERVSLPVAVKISPYFTNLASMAERLAAAGADGLVLFNRFYQPDFDLESETVEPSLDLSRSAELRLRLRWAALLYGQIEADIAVTGGVHTAVDALKAIFAGANVAMMTSALYQNGLDHLATVRRDMEAWLDDHQHKAVSAVRGRLSLRQTRLRDALERANYMHVIKSYEGDAE